MGEPSPCVQPSSAVPSAANGVSRQGRRHCPALAARPGLRVLAREFSAPDNLSWRRARPGTLALVRARTRQADQARRLSSIPAELADRRSLGVPAITSALGLNA